MNKEKVHVIIAGCISTFAVLSALFAFSDFAMMAKGGTKSSEWMKNVDGNKYLSEISLPGTHDSGARYSIGDLAGKCQDANIGSQLTFGVRFLDIRLKYNGPKDFSVIHGIVDERLDFGSVYGDCRGFLRQHPSETIIMSVKNEDGGNKDIFAGKLEEYLTSYEDVIYMGNNIPKLEDVRGKIVIFARYRDNQIGVNLHDGWQDPSTPEHNNTFDIVRGEETYHIQDHYSLKSAEAKWEEAKECLSYAMNNTDKNIYCINFMSGVLNGSFPPSYSVPVAKYVNKQFLKEYKNYTSMGTVLFDFVTEDLAKAVYERNF